MRRYHLVLPQLTILLATTDDRQSPLRRFSFCSLFLSSFPCLRIYLRIHNADLIPRRSVVRQVCASRREQTPSFAVARIIGRRRQCRRVCRKAGPYEDARTLVHYFYCSHVCLDIIRARQACEIYNKKNNYNWTNWNCNKVICTQ